MSNITNENRPQKVFLASRDSKFYETSSTTSNTIYITQDYFLYTSEITIKIG